MEDIYFFLHPEDYERVQSFSALEGYDFRQPQINWIWSTYFRLRKKGHTNIHLVSEIPEKGIVVMPSNQQSYFFRKFPRQTLVMVAVADSPPWFYNQVNISQNRFQHSEYPNFFEYPKWIHIPHWPQPNLIARNAERGDKFENIAFLGDRSQLAPELSGSEFVKELAELGLKFELVEKGFNDYSNIDCVLAIRSFSKQKMTHKPYSKLVNAWLAGVPPIVGLESSFQSVKQSDLDFIEVENKNELIAALKKLKDDKDLRRKMVANGLERVKEFNEETTLKQWEDLLFNKAQTIYKDWTSKGAVRRAIFHADLLMSRLLRSAKNRVIKVH